LTIPFKQVEDLQNILKGGKRLKAVAGMIVQAEKAKKDSMGQATSSACTLQ